MENSPIKSVTPLFEGNVVIKLGIFDHIPQPKAEAFVARRQMWLPALEGATQYNLDFGGEVVNDATVGS